MIIIIKKVLKLYKSGLYICMGNFYAKLILCHRLNEIIVFYISYLRLILEAFIQKSI